MGKNAEQNADNGNETNISPTLPEPLISPDQTNEEQPLRSDHAKSGKMGTMLFL